MKTICKHAYPADLCGTCNPTAKEKPDARRSAAACSASFVQVAAGKETWWEQITRLQSERDQAARLVRRLLRSHGEKSSRRSVAARSDAGLWLARLETLKKDSHCAK